MTTGPITDVKLIIEESSAYAVRKKSSGTMSFHNGRTDKLIGGAVAPSTNAVINNDSLDCMVFKVNIKVAYEGTKMRSGHFCPQRSITEPRIPAVRDPAKEFNPIAKPAAATDPVVCWVLKKMPSAIIEYAKRAGNALIAKTSTCGMPNNSL